MPDLDLISSEQRKYLISSVEVPVPISHPRSSSGELIPATISLLLPRTPAASEGRLRCASAGRGCSSVHRVAEQDLLNPPPSPSSSASPAAPMAGSEAEQKVVVHVRSAGNAPILKQDKFKISGRDKFLRVIEFLRRQLHQDTLFVYVNSSFSPSPDELIIDLYNNFAIDGKLVVNYALSAAWG